MARLNTFAAGYARLVGDPFVRAVFRLVAAERRRLAPVAGFYDHGRADFGGVLIEIIAGLEKEGRLRAPRPATAAGQLMGMIEHTRLFLIPIVTGGEVESSRTPEEVAAKAPWRPSSRATASVLV